MADWQDTITQFMAASAAPAGDWWKVAGLVAGDFAGVYVAKGKASTADAKLNDNDPGTNDLSAISDPPWSSGGGWAPTGSHALNTGLLPANDQSWSFMVWFANASVTNATPVGVRNVEGQNRSFEYSPQVSSGRVAYSNGAVLLYSTGNVASGAAGVAGNRPHIDGAYDGVGTIGVWAGTSFRPVYICAGNVNGSPANYFTGNVYAAVFGNLTWSLAQIAALEAAGNTEMGL